MRIQSLHVVCLLAALCTAVPAAADSTARASQDSATISAASGAVVAGSLDFVAGGGELLVTSIEAVGDSMIIGLYGVSDATTVSLQLSGEVAGTASLAVGAAIQVSAEATGYALRTAGRLIAFIPNEVGYSLLHHSRHDGEL
ncbi:MAG: hypothetical protein KIT18_12505 [Burkholderiales bacterium]|nr:hypothetical protein [Burkholderiales bacterium]